MSNSKFTTNHTKSDSRSVSDKISPDVTDEDKNDSSVTAEVIWKFIKWLLKQKWWLVLIITLIFTAIIIIA